MIPFLERETVVLPNRVAGYPQVSGNLPLALALTETMDDVSNVIHVQSLHFFLR